MASALSMGTKTGATEGPSGWIHLEDLEVIAAITGNQLGRSLSIGNSCLTSIEGSLQEIMDGKQEEGELVVQGGKESMKNFVHPLLKGESCQ